MNFARTYFENKES